MIIYRAYLQRVRVRVMDFTCTYVRSLLQKNVRKRTRRIMVQYIRAVVRVQSVIRMYVRRKQFLRVRAFVRTLLCATIKVQKMWRKSKEGNLAREILDKLRVVRGSTYSTCVCAHEVLARARGQTGRFFRVLDPRAGLKISGLLHRLGEGETLILFSFVSTIISCCTRASCAVLHCSILCSFILLYYIWLYNNSNVTYHTSRDKQSRLFTYYMNRNLQLNS